ncbi:hypothetical protein [Peijinzhouia sedimentorum]
MADNEKKLKRALSVADILKKNFELFEFEGEWYQAFGKPERRGVWLIWGDSGNGKSSFLMQLIKELCNHARVVFNSLEEGDGHTMQMNMIRAGMHEVSRKMILVNESMEDLSSRLSRHKSPEVAVIDSWQYMDMSFKDFIKFKQKHSDKLLIIISQADGKKPMGRPAVSVMYDASLKIWVEGFKAFSKGRYIGPNGGEYTIYEEGAATYHGNN